MVLTLYDKTHNYVGSIVKKNDLKIESQLDNGDKTLSFVYMDDSLEMTPECYIRDGRDEFVVKEVDRTTTGFPVIYAALNLEELEGKAWKTFQAEDCTISEAAQLAIAGTGWTVAGSDVSKKRNAGIVKKSALGVLQDLCTAFMCEMSFDTINKTITFHEQRGSDRGVYFLAGLNLLQLTKKSDSYDFYTRIVPYGADGLDIKEVNSGREYLDNNQYSGKVRTYIWEDTNYTDAQALKDDAAAKLADMSKPKVSYSAQVIDLAEMSADYSLLDYGLGDTVTLIDKNTGTRDKQRIVRLTEYPEEPDRNTCEMSNTFLTWEEMQAKLQASAAIVDALIGSDGNYNGTIKVSDILHFTDGVVGTSSGSNVTLGNFFQTTTGAIGALNLEVGRISANMLTAETADLRYANITFGNLDTANINTAKVKDLFVEVGLIKDAVISGAKITGYLDAVEVNAANITAGTLIADRIAIRGSTTSLVYALNNYGQIVSQQTNTLDGYILTERTINANKIVANSITGGEIAANTITAFNIVGSSLSAIYADLGEITAGVLKSVDYQYSSGNYSTAGMMIDLNNKVIRTPKFAVDVNGKLYATGADVSGAITASSGKIGGWNIGATSGTGELNGSLYYGTFGAANSIYLIPAGTTTSKAIAGRTGTDWVITAGKNFGVTKTGAVYTGGLTLSAGNAYGTYVEFRDASFSLYGYLQIDSFYNRFYAPKERGWSFNAYDKAQVSVISTSANTGTLVLRAYDASDNAYGFYINPTDGVVVTGPVKSQGNIYVGVGKTNPYSDVGSWVGGNGNITLVLDSTSGIGGGIYFGYKGVNTYSAGIRLSGAGTIEVLGHLVAAKSSGQAAVYASNSGTGNRIFIYADSSNGQAGLYSYSTDNTNRPILIRANNSNDITAYGNWTASGSWLFNDTLYLSKNGDQYIYFRLLKNDTYINQILCGHTGNNLFFGYGGYSNNIGATYFDGNEVHIRTKSTISLEGGSVSISGACTVDGAFQCKNYAGNAGRPVTSASTDGKQVSALECYSSTSLRISGQWGTTGTTFAWRYATVSTSASDIRLKTNIEDCTVTALPLINNIRMRAFDWKEDGKHQEIGFIADELEELDSRLSIGGGYDDGIMNVKSVDTFYLLGYLVKAVQELSAEVSRLKGAA